MSERNPSDVARMLALAAAVLLLIGLLTGGYVSAGMTGMLPVDPHAALAAHLSAIMGSFWILGLALTVHWLRLDATWLRRLAWLTIVPQYGNWAVTVVKAWWKVSGVAPNGEGYNDTIFGLLTALVVVPSLMAAGGWIYGLAKKPLTP